MRVGVDTGGTFTDLVAADGSIAKVPSTPSDPGNAVRDAIDDLAAGRPDVLAHGTTVATNTLLERDGARVALVTNAGMEDVIEIARQDRPSLYDIDAVRPAPLVARPDRVGVAGRLGPDGSELQPLGPVPDVGDVDAVAVCLLHADLDDAHERAVGGVLRDRGHDVTCSFEVAPEMREYERTVTTVVNAYLRPRCRSYLEGIEGEAGEVVVMSSAGGLVPLPRAADVPAALLLSGPAGGVRAAAAIAAACGFPDAVTFDMGGTSTDVCLVLDGAPAPAAQREVAGLPVRLPSLDIHTIGAGGGSIARIDPGGALAVGPRSAGAVPGPACYGRGGTEPTVTDADLVLGRIAASAAFPGLGTLDADAASDALSRAGVPAEGVIAVVDAAMEQAIRVVTVERGVDPRPLALVAFGGAGPLHACALADALGMAAVIVPPRAGVLSAVGLLCAPVQHDAVQSWPTPSVHDGLEDAHVKLAVAASAAVGGGATVDLSLDCRYEGQSHELTVADVGDFEAEHTRRNGYARPGAPIEVVALRARATSVVPVDVTALPAPARDAVVGPAVVTEPDCTVWVPEGWRADVEGEVGAWILRRI
jgi:N-methylhydantoinase A/oxoprolinase/acetone carboxylase beta subunit